MALRRVGTWIGILVLMAFVLIVGIALSHPPRGVQTPIIVQASIEPDLRRHITIPVKGVKAEDIQDTFDQRRGTERRHEATDIVAPRGAEVIAADDGVIKKLFYSKPGGITIYQFDPAEQFCYYYAHLDRYAEGIFEGKAVKRGQVIGYVGATGNAATPHLHFGISQLDDKKRWWEGTPINPYPILMRRPH